MNIISPKATATHIISGFLGAGKTTLLQHLLQQKPEHERWAVLMNEFGKIGVDQLFLPNTDGFAVKEVLGGCLCCTSQLPLQIALARLLNEYQPDRLFIEPTGLGHPAQLLQQLTEPHWQTRLAMRQLITVIDGSRLTDGAWSKHSLYQDQIQAAQMVLVSHTDLMTDADHAALADLQQQFATFEQRWQHITLGQIQITEIDITYTAPKRVMRPLLQQQSLLKNLRDNHPRANHLRNNHLQDNHPPENHVQEDAVASDTPILELPYHYQEQSQGFRVVGWRLPKSWQFDYARLMDVLCAEQDFLRLKAIFYSNHPQHAWQYFNCNSSQFNVKSGEANLDNRLEIIYQTERDWQDFEAALLATRVDSQFDPL